MDPLDKDMSLSGQDETGLHETSSRSSKHLKLGSSLLVEFSIERFKIPADLR